MGTDIYMCAEVKRNGAWHLIVNLEENIEYYPEDDPNAQHHEPLELCINRNYNLFGILADVRNPNGITLNGQKFDVIAPPRGLPEDLSPEILDSLKDWQDEMSSINWLLLSEILQFDWYGKVMHYEAMVDARVAHLFEESKPFPFDRWPEDIQMGYSAYMRDGVTVRWADTYAASIGTDVLELFNGLKQYGEPSTIRLVFWFSH